MQEQSEHEHESRHDEEQGQELVARLRAMQLETSTLGESLSENSEDFQLISALGFLCSEEEPVPLRMWELILLAQDGVATRYRKGDGQTCAHLILEKRHEPERLEILRAMLTANPKLATVTDLAYLRPIDQLTQRILMMEEVRKYVALELEERQEDFFECARLLLLAESDLALDANVPMLHACLRSPNVPNSLLSLSMREFGDSEAARDTDMDGNLPLHWAAARDPEEDDGAFIRILLRHCADGARVQNREGRTPLFLALAAGRDWDKGCEELFRAAPDMPVVTDVPWEQCSFVLDGLARRNEPTLLYHFLRFDFAGLYSARYFID